MSKTKLINELKAGDKFYGINWTWYGGIDILDCTVESIQCISGKTDVTFQYTVLSKDSPNGSLQYTKYSSKFSVGNIRAASPVVSAYSDKYCCFYADINLFNERLNKLINSIFPHSLLNCIDFYNKIKLETDETDYLS